MNTDLTKFNLLHANFLVATKLVRLDIDDFHFVVVIWNFDDMVAFELPNKLDLDVAEALALKVFNAEVVNLTLWDTSDFLEYTQRSDVENGYVECHTYAPIGDDDDPDAGRAAAIDQEFHQAAKDRESMEFYGHL